MQARGKQEDNVKGNNKLSQYMVDDIRIVEKEFK
jgi:hypothetical protein